MDEFLQAALDIAKAQASVRVMTEDQLADYVQNVAEKIRKIQSGEVEPEDEGSAWPTVTPEEAKKSIRENTISCLICGKKCRVLTKRHLDKHGIYAKEYREHFGLKKDTPLVAKSLLRERRAKMEEMRIWERRKMSDAE
ncbi:MAG: MucR family transcriptional regulator [Desulfovibrionaceae bacterium]|nr:MucR family transcriptional regulator [Desulfovibrionaceae bacterium]